MSGSGSGGFGSGTPYADVACDLLEFGTQISSPKELVVARIKVGDILLVTLDQQGPSQVVVIKLGNEVAGGITSPRIARLLECIRQGTRYAATVTGKTDGQVSVRITPIV
ncbi:hypothetical protein [Xanthomonas sp. BRIP62411]|uniref:hypothetical protein n=1 Tax=Xanthomonas sp. BRIP62411 TaxID=2182389 RepID=UPI000F8EAC27|nr:hypothetical protein [Xanthomonas sp. BRIP62411]